MIKGSGSRLSWKEIIEDKGSVKIERATNKDKFISTVHTRYTVSNTGKVTDGLFNRKRLYRQFLHATLQFLWAFKAWKISLVKLSPTGVCMIIDVEK